jgi:hypothetical protein
LLLDDRCDAEEIAPAGHVGDLVVLHEETPAVVDERREGHEVEVLVGRDDQALVAGLQVLLERRDDQAVHALGGREHVALLGEGLAEVVDGGLHHQRVAEVDRDGLAGLMEHERHEPEAVGREASARGISRCIIHVLHEGGVVGHGGLHRLDGDRARLRAVHRASGGELVREVVVLGLELLEERGGIEPQPAAGRSGPAAGSRAAQPDGGDLTTDLDLARRDSLVVGLLEESDDARGVGGSVERAPLAPQDRLEGEAHLRVPAAVAGAAHREEVVRLRGHHRELLALLGLAADVEEAGQVLLLGIGRSLAQARRLVLLALGPAHQRQLVRGERVEVAGAAIGLLHAREARAGELAGGLRVALGDGGADAVVLRRLLHVGARKLFRERADGVRGLVGLGKFEVVVMQLDERVRSAHEAQPVDGRDALDHLHRLEDGVLSALVVSVAALDVPQRHQAIDEGAGSGLPLASDLDDALLRGERLRLVGAHQVVRGEARVLIGDVDAVRALLLLQLGDDVFTQRLALRELERVVVEARQHACHEQVRGLALAALRDVG